MPYYLDEHGISYRKIMDELYESHNVLGHNGSTSLYNFIEKHYYWRKLHQHSNKYVRSCLNVSMLL